MHDPNQSLFNHHQDNSSCQKGSSKWWWVIPIIVLLSNIDLFPLDMRSFVDIVRALGNPDDKSWLHNPFLGKLQGPDQFLNFHRHTSNKDRHCFA